MTQISACSAVFHSSVSLHRRRRPHHRRPCPGRRGSAGAAGRGHRHRHARAESVDKIPGAINVISEEEVARSLTLTQDATAVLARTVPGYSESGQTMNTLGENLRGRAPLRLFDGIPQSTPLRDGSRNGAFTDMDASGASKSSTAPPRGRHRRGRRHHQLHFQGADRGRHQGQPHHALLTRSSRTTAKAGRSASKSRTSRMRSTTVLRRRTATAASPMTPTAAASA